MSTSGSEHKQYSEQAVVRKGGSETDGSETERQSKHTLKSERPVSCYSDEVTGQVARHDLGIGHLMLVQVCPQ